MTEWPGRIELIGATLRKLPAGRDARCSINGAKDAERVYVTDKPDPRTGTRISYRLCLKHATEWARMR